MLLLSPGSESLQIGYTQLGSVPGSILALQLESPGDQQFSLRSAKTTFFIIVLRTRTSSIKVHYSYGYRIQYHIRIRDTVSGILETSSIDVRAAMRC